MGNAGEKSSVDQIPEEGMSSQSLAHVHRYGGQQGADGHGTVSTRIEYTAYASPHFDTTRIQQGNQLSEIRNFSFKSNHADITREVFLIL